MAALPITPGYMQPGKIRVNSGTAVGYTYPQTAAPYAAAPYPSLLTAPSSYTTQGQSPYNPVSVKKDQRGLLQTQSLGTNSYPYYYPKQ